MGLRGDETGDGPGGPEVPGSPVVSASPETPPERIAAAIDIGSNSTHLVVAGVEDDGRLTVLADASAFAPLGDLVARDGRFGESTRGALVETLRDYAGEARRLGARWITIVGTEPVRMATDRDELARAIGDLTGIPLEVLTHEDEAHLMVIGVQAGRPVVGNLLVVDIGGGSTEFCLVGASGVRWTAGLKIGSSGLARRHVSGDPPSEDEMRAMVAEARVALSDAPDAGSASIVAVGGTASNLVRLVPGTLAAQALTRAAMADVRKLLLTMSTDVAIDRYAFKPARARLLPAGAAIIEALFDRYGVDRIAVAETGLREGVIHAVASAGTVWRNRLAELAAGWRD